MRDEDAKLVREHMDVPWDDLRQARTLKRTLEAWDAEIADPADFALQSRAWRRLGGGFFASWISPRGGFGAAAVAVAALLFFISARYAARHGDLSAK